MMKDGDPSSKEKGHVSIRHIITMGENSVKASAPLESSPSLRVGIMERIVMVLAKSCGITSVAALLASLLDTSYSTMRQRLREWCYDKSDKKGEHRQELDVTLSFAPLLSWV